MATVVEAVEAVEAATVAVGVAPPVTGSTVRPTRSAATAPACRLRIAVGDQPGSAMPIPPPVAPRRRGRPAAVSARSKATPSALMARTPVPRSWSARARRTARTGSASTSSARKPRRTRKGSSVVVALARRPVASVSLSAITRTNGSGQLQCWDRAAATIPRRSYHQTSRGLRLRTV